MINNKIVKITSKEGRIMQGFPEGFAFPVMETQAMKQLGNSVAVDAIAEYGKAIIERLGEAQFQHAESITVIAGKKKKYFPKSFLVSTPIAR